MSRFEQQVESSDAELLELRRANEYLQRQVNELGGACLRADGKIVYLSMQLAQSQTAFSLLAQMHRQISGAKVERTVYEAAVRTFCSQFKMDRALTLERVPNEPTAMRATTWMGLGPPHVEWAESAVLQVPESLLRDAETFIWGRENRGAQATFAQAVAKPLDLETVAVLPIAFERETIAAIVVGRVKRANATTDMPLEPENRHLFSPVASMISATVTNVRREREKLALETQISGGFAHEMRNTLSAARIMLGRAFTEGPEGAVGPTVCEGNASHLGEIFREMESRFAPLTPHVAPLLARVNQNEAMLHEVLVESQHSIVRALRITEQILEYSRVGSSRIGTELVDVEAVTRQWLIELKPGFDEAGIEVDVRTEGDHVTRADEAHVSSVVSNLLINAKDALCELDAGTPRRLSVKIRRDGEFNRLCVADSGKGISADALPRIFEPFFTTKPRQGTGLGLGMVKKLVNLYGGSIEVDPGPGRGARFTVALPFASPRGVPHAERP